MSSLSESEIQKRIQLGLVTYAPPNSRAQQDDEMEHWEDIEDEGKDSTSEESDEDFVLDEKRRSSIDLCTMTMNAHDQGSENAVSVAAAAAFTICEFEPNKRQRSRKPMVASISEEAVVDDEEIATVDGEAEDMELRATEEN